MMKRWNEIETVMMTYGAPLTAQELSALMPDVPLGTVTSQLSQATKRGRVSMDTSTRPRTYWLNNDWDPETVHIETRSAKPEDPWTAVQQQWRSVFGLAAPVEDIKLMVGLAVRMTR